MDNFFTSVKSGILLALKYSENNEIEKIKTIEAPLWNMVLQKILCIYFPDKFITIGAPDVLIECARDIHIEGIELKPENAIQINFECKKALSLLPEFKEWTYEEIAKELKITHQGVQYIEKKALTKIWAEREKQLWSYP